MMWYHNDAIFSTKHKFSHFKIPFSLILKAVSIVRISFHLSRLPRLDGRLSRQVVATIYDCPYIWVSNWMFVTGHTAMCVI